MANQKLFEALQDVTGFIALESDMAQILEAVRQDRIEQIGPDLIELEEERLEWSLKTFPKADAYSALLHLEKEIEEIREDLPVGSMTMDKKDALAIEYADALMCLFDSAARMGYTLSDIARAFEKKLVINKARRWKKNPDNTYSHIKNGDSAP